MFLTRAKALYNILRSIQQQPRLSFWLLQQLPYLTRGVQFGQAWPRPISPAPKPEGEGIENPLHTYYEAHITGRGIWKWEHYLEIYHQHFQRFRGREVHVLEIGIYSGGSLEMWRDYFGPACQVYGVDIEEACQIYEGKGTRIFIGDQGDRGFWQQFRAQVPRVDILIDDGCHLPEQQIVTLEEMLPHLQPGGVYLCEDLLGLPLNPFVAYLNGLTAQLNAFDFELLKDCAQGLVWPTIPWQADIKAVHFYPNVSVIEKSVTPVSELSAPKKGTEWQPFL